MRLTLRVATMLAAYLMWICGTTFIALSCHIDNLDRGSHCCASCACHHEGCEANHLESPHACDHDHSNRVILYDTAKQPTLNLEPAERCIAALTGELLHIEDISTQRTALTDDRDTPLPPSPRLSRRGMRAPPVVA